MRYILALIPPKETAAAWIQAAQMLFAHSGDGYLLSEKSLPHITVCQFECDTESQAQQIWGEIRALNVPPLPIRFTGVSFVKGMGVHDGMYWAEVSAARDERIMQVHRFAAAILKAHGLLCLNDSGDLYRPHLTLARIRLPGQIQRWPDTLLHEACPFGLSLAHGDHNGQYLYTIYE